jgi:type I restriction enzyme S subunit
MSNNLPPNWSWVKLGDVVEKMSNGCSATQYQDKGDYPITRIETISFSEVDLNRVRYVKNISENDKKKYRLHYNDILFSHINSDSHLGKTALFKHKDKIVIHGINLLLIRVNKNVHSDFLNYLFNYFRIKGEFLKIAQHAVNQSSINQKKLKDVEIPLPPLSEQKNIVTKIEELFSQLETGVASLKKAKEQIGKYRISVIKAAFEGNLTREWRQLHKTDIALAEDFLVSLQIAKQEYYTRQINTIRRKKSSEIDLSVNDVDTLKKEIRIPKSWQWTSIGNIFDISYGLSEPLIKTSPSESNDVPIIRIPNVTEFGNLELSELKYFPLDIARKKRLLLRKEDVLFNWRNAPKWIGRTAVFDKDGEYVNASFLLKLRPFKIGYSKFVSFFLNYLRISGFFLTRVDNAVNQANFNASLLSKIPVPFPGLDEQSAIIEEKDRLLSEVDNLEKVINESLIKTETLRQSILKQAFEGKLI